MGDMQSTEIPRFKQQKGFSNKKKTTERVVLKISAKLRIQVVASQKDASGGHVRPEVTNSCKKGVVIPKYDIKHLY